MKGVFTSLVLLLCTVISYAASDAIICYNCDNAKSAACGRNFKAYQFEPISCPDRGGQKGKCGKQEQLPDPNGWVGVIRSCYYPGELAGVNETNGCHYYTHPDYNFTALYCFCDTAYCNSAPHTRVNYVLVIMWACLSTISALVVHPCL